MLIQEKKKWATEIWLKHTDPENFQFSKTIDADPSNITSKQT